ncbi:leucine-rich repeat domain-containing protein [Marinigracilibium pacificum]|uniref:Leucine-rich repeat domain-containing protein n=1 Tax=Marinigracilibium pacificum TaxID=2729599 RepID=A0A848IWV3_9BACT|nr:leucine-rich repeat domain-containing protein [Marinigracilibium pacificum]NMM47648.1 leucine-rich repeat domain-containing protein [Marinigracilibium pacificum]
MKKLILILFIPILSCQEASHEFKVYPEINSNGTNVVFVIEKPNKSYNFEFLDCFCYKTDSSVNVVHVNSGSFVGESFILAYYNGTFQSSLESWSDVGYPPIYSFEIERLTLNSSEFNVGDSLFGQIETSGKVYYHDEQSSNTNFTLRGAFQCIVRDSTYGFQEYQDDLQTRWKKERFNNFITLSNSDSSLLIPIVDLNNLNLDSIPEEVQSFKNAYELGLIGNNISYINIDLLSKLNKLRTILLQNNEIDYLPPELRLLSNIEILNLSSNPINDINSIYSLTNLKELDLSLTEIKEISDQISKLRKLEKLDLGVNDQLESISDEIFELPKLKDIHFPETLKSLNLEGTNLNQINTLWCPFDLLKENENGLKKMTSLKLIYVEYHYRSRAEEKAEHSTNRKWIEDRIPYTTIVDIKHIIPKN